MSIISAPDWMLVRELIGTAAGVSRRRLTGKMVFVTLAMSWLHRMRLRTKACRRGMKLPQRIERVSVSIALKRPSSFVTFEMLWADPGRLQVAARAVATTLHRGPMAFTL